MLAYKDKDVQLLVACGLADVLRIFAPDAPYMQEQLKVRGRRRGARCIGSGPSNGNDGAQTIFMLFVEQLRGIAKPKSPGFTRHFYLLENLAVVQSFIICAELEATDVIVDLFRLFFSIVTCVWAAARVPDGRSDARADGLRHPRRRGVSSEEHSHKVVAYMLDIMASIVQEADVVAPELLDVIMENMLPAVKRDNPPAHALAKSLIERTSTHLQPAVHEVRGRAARRAVSAGTR